MLLATSSPDDLFGSACQVQALIGAKGAAAFDLTAACSGFVMGLITAAQFIQSGTYKNVLVIGADALSRYVDWRDRGASGGRPGAFFHFLEGEALRHCRFRALPCHSCNAHLRARHRAALRCRHVYSVWGRVRRGGGASVRGGVQLSGS